MFCSSSSFRFRLAFVLHLYLRMVPLSLCFDRIRIEAPQLQKKPSKQGRNQIIKSEDHSADKISTTSCLRDAKSLVVSLLDVEKQIQIQTGTHQSLFQNSTTTERNNTATKKLIGCSLGAVCIIGVSSCKQYNNSVVEKIAAVACYAAIIEKVRGKHMLYRRPES